MTDEKKKLNGDFSDHQNGGLRVTERQYFLQDPPRLGNSFLENTQLRELLGRLLPADLRQRTVEPDLIRFGYRCCTQLTRWGNESEKLKPELQQFDGYGVKVDRVHTSPYWDLLVGVQAEEGLVALGHSSSSSSSNSADGGGAGHSSSNSDGSADLGPWARIYQFAKVLMYAEVAAVADCPLAMTQGAVKLVHELPASAMDQSVRQSLLRRLLSRRPHEYATSGQWMTERTGGSDVRRTQTTAAPVHGRQYLLTGYKYFTSAVTSQMAFALARCHGDQHLSLFYVPMRLTVDGKDPNLMNLESSESSESSSAAGFASGGGVDQEHPLNNIVVHRLKDKLGTRAVPTAELELRQTKALLVGERGRGVPLIASLFNITRIQNATGAAANIRRALAVCRDFTWRRHAFGRRLSDLPLHLETLARVEVEHRGCHQMVFDSVRLLGLSEAATTGAPERRLALRLLRLLTPLCKLYTAKQAVSCVSECLEALGALGYMEDGHVPRILRDSQVLPIWEGTTNVLCMDLLRALHKDPTVLQELITVTRHRIATAAAAAAAQPGPAASTRTTGCSQLIALEQLVEPCLRRLEQPTLLPTLSAMDGRGARSFAYTLARVYVAGLLAEHAAHQNTAVAAEAAFRWFADEPMVTAGRHPTYTWLPSAPPAPAPAPITYVPCPQLTRQLALDSQQNGPHNVDSNNQPRPRL